MDTQISSWSEKRTRKRQEEKEEETERERRRDDNEMAEGDLEGEKACKRTERSAWKCENKCERGGQMSKYHTG